MAAIIDLDGDGYRLVASSNSRHGVALLGCAKAARRQARA
jgi:hypothetical protein